MRAAQVTLCSLPSIPSMLCSCLGGEDRSDCCTVQYYRVVDTLGAHSSMPGSQRRVDVVATGTGTVRNRR